MAKDQNKTYEEYQEELVQILGILNKYNEDILNEVEPLITEEEYTKFQERYEYLNEKVSLPEEEEEVETKISWINKVNPFVFIIGIVSIVASNYWLSTIIGSTILAKILNSLPEEELVKKTIMLYSIISTLIYPVSLLLFNTVFLFIFRKPENKKMFRIFYFILVGLVLIVLTINLVIAIKAVMGAFA